MKCSGSARAQAIYAHSRGTYGAPRIHAELADAGTTAPARRVGICTLGRHRLGSSTASRQTCRPSWASTTWPLSSTCSAGGSVGWTTTEHLRTALVFEALEMALAHRWPAAVIHHSDRGCQYTSRAFGARCPEWSVALSRGPVGDCFDNAMAESFFGTLEC